MRVLKSDILLSGAHPSLLPDLAPQPAVFAPIVLNRDGLLVDGYRRFRIEPAAAMEAVVVDAANVFEAAVAMNMRTRAWDEVDGLLWSRWAEALNVPALLPASARFAPELRAADTELLALIASRLLTPRQAVLILQSPPAHQPFFRNFLSGTVRLNNNETRDFIEMCCDLKKTMAAARVEDVVLTGVPGTVVADPALDMRRKGERLLKEMRVLRYPYYQRKSDEFERHWQELDLGRSFRVDRSHFLERGKLDITVTSASRQEMRESVERWARSLDLTSWRKIWEE